MSGKIAAKGANTLNATLLGTAAFLISGTLASIMILLAANYILALMAAGSSGTILFCLFLRMRQKLGRLALTGLLAAPAGLMFSFGLIEGMGALFPAVGAIFENSPVPDIAAVMLIAAVFGALIGAVAFGRKAVGTFFAVCGAAALPFGMLVAAANSERFFNFKTQYLPAALIRMDWNFLIIITALGAGIGLSTGLYRTSKQL